MKNGKRILSITILRKLDTDPDTSYLEQDEFKERLAQYKEGQFEYIGIYASAFIQTRESTDAAPWGCVQTIRSGGLWGIESDSDKSHLAEVDKEQLAELRGELEALGFSKRAISTAFKNVQEDVEG